MYIASARTGKVMYEKDYSSSTKSPIRCLGWASQCTNISDMEMPLSKFEDGMTLDEFLVSSQRLNDPQGVPNLPVELAFIDIAGTLPKLSTLPIGGYR